MVRNVSSPPQQEKSQESLDLPAPKKPRKKASTSVPKALQPPQLVDNEPTGERISAGLLLSWFQPNVTQKLGLKVSPRFASLLLQIFPPALCVQGSKKWGCGNTQLSAALLALLPADELVEVRYIAPDHPLASVQLPIHFLLEKPAIEELLPTVLSLAKLLGDGERATQEALASTCGVSQATISRLLKKIDPV